MRPHADCGCWSKSRRDRWIGFALKWRREISRPQVGLSSAALSVSAALSLWMDGEGECWASIPMIAGHAGLSQTWTKKGIGELRDAGVLEWASGRRAGSRGGPGRGHANEYQAIMPEIKRPPSDRFGSEDPAEKTVTRSSENSHSAAEKGHIVTPKRLSSKKHTSYKKPSDATRRPARVRTDGEAVPIKTAVEKALRSREPDP